MSAHWLTGEVPRGVLESGPHSRWDRLGGLPVVISVRIPVAGLCLRDVVELRPGDLVRSLNPMGQDVPVWAGDARIGVAEFENRDGVMAVRLTGVGA